jgi:hypothetical protein
MAFFLYILIKNSYNKRLIQGEIMRSVEDYAKAIIENSNLNFNKLTPRYAVDKEKKISISFRKPNEWYKWVRFLKINGTEEKPFLYLQEDGIRNITMISLVIRDNDKSDFVRITSYGGHDIVVFQGNYQEEKMTINPKLNIFIDGANLVVLDENNNRKEITDSKFVINDIYKLIVNMNHVTEKWNEIINSMLDFIKPAIDMIVSDANDVMKRQLNEQEETKFIVSHKK